MIGKGAKAITVGNCAAAQRVKGVSLSACRKQTFFSVMCAFIPLSCWTVLRCTEFTVS